MIVSVFAILHNAVSTATFLKNVTHNLSNFSRNQFWFLFILSSLFYNHAASNGDWIVTIRLPYTYRALISLGL